MILCHLSPPPPGDGLTWVIIFSLVFLAHGSGTKASDRKAKISLALWQIQQ